MAALPPISLDGPTASRLCNCETIKLVTPPGDQPAKILRRCLAGRRPSFEGDGRRYQVLDHLSDAEIVRWQDRLAALEELLRVDEHDFAGVCPAANVGRVGLT
jgi:hypothetical protein